MAWTNKGVSFAALGRHQEALKAYDKAIEIKPDDHKAWHNKGNAIRKLGRYEEALKVYDKAIEIKPDFHLAWSNKVDALRKLGRDEEAIKVYQQATKCNVVDLKREDITAKQVLYRMAKKYREFEFKKVKDDMQDLPHQIIWRKGNKVQTWSNLRPSSWVESSESLIFAIASATGVSDGAALTIPKMLLPKEIIGGSLTDMTEAKRIKDAKSKEVDCFRIKGMYNERRITLWIDKKTFLVLRIDEQRKTSDNSRTETTLIRRFLSREKICPPAVHVSV